MTDEREFVASPVAGVHSFLLEDEIVVLAERQQRLFGFNGAAAVLWLCVGDGLDRAATLRDAVAALGLSPSATRTMLDQMLAVWGASGLLAAGTESATVTTTAPVAAAPRPARESASPARPAKAVGSLPTYRLLDSRFTVDCTDPAQRPLVAAALAHLAAPAAPGPAPDTVSVTIVANAGQHAILLDGSELERVPTDGLAPALARLLGRHAAHRRGFQFAIHAGAVGDGSGCVLLPAPAGSGKSTLTAALVQAGLTYFSDEIALLESDGLRVLPLPFGISLKSGAWKALRTLLPGLAVLPTHRREDGLPIRLWLPPAEAVAAPDAEGRVRCLIFPHYREGGASALAPLGRAAALRRLLGECLAVPVPLTGPSVARLVDWIGGLDCYTLSLSSLAPAVAVVRGALAKAACRNQPASRQTGSSA